MTRVKSVVLVLCLGLCVAGCGSEETDARPELKAELVRTLEGHAEVVWRVAFSPDGAWRASGGYDKTVKLWRLGGATAIAP